MKRLLSDEITNLRPTFFRRFVYCTDAVMGELFARTLEQAVEKFLISEVDDLVRCGLSRAAAKDAVNDLCENGWWIVEDPATGDEASAGTNPQHIA